MKTLDDYQLGTVRGALDSLGVALTSHGHQWTEGEREIYEQAVSLCESIPAGLLPCPKCGWHHASEDVCPHNA